MAKIADVVTTCKSRWSEPRVESLQNWRLFPEVVSKDRVSGCVLMSKCVAYGDPWMDLAWTLSFPEG